MVCRWVISSAAPNATPLSSEPPHTGKSAGSTAALSQYYVSQLSEVGRLSRRSSGTLLERWGIDFVHEALLTGEAFRLALADLQTSSRYLLVSARPGCPSISLRPERHSGP